MTSFGRALPRPNTAVRGLSLLIVHMFSLWTTASAHPGGLLASDDFMPLVAHRCDVDSLGSAPACAHCGAIFGNMESLRSHIAQGRCIHYNPAAKAETSDIQEVYSRSADLANHLMHCHARLWRQLAMVYYRLQRVPFMPVEIPETVADNTSFLCNTCCLCGEEHAHGTLYRHLCEAHMSTHRFVEFYCEELLPAFTRFLQTDHRCDMCHQIFNLPAEYAPDDSHAHRKALVQAHLKGHCPVLLQSSLLLATALNGCGLGNEHLGGECTEPDLRHVQATGAHDRSQLAPDLQPEVSQVQTHRGSARSRRRSRTPRPTATGPHDEDAAGDGLLGAPTRAQLELAAKHRLFHSLLPAGEGRHPPGTGHGDAEMASTATTAPRTTDAPPTAPVHVDDNGDAQPRDQSGGEQAGERAGQNLLGKEPDISRHVLAISVMGCESEEVGGGQTTADIDGQDAGTPEGTHRGPEGSTPGGQIPEHGTGEPAGHHPVAPATQLAPGQTLRSPGCNGGIGNVGADGHQPTDAQTEVERPGNDPTIHASFERQGQGEGRWQGKNHGQDAAATVEFSSTELQQLRQLATRLTFANSSAWCFANVTMNCFIWTLLCLSENHAKLWGKHFELMRGFMHTFDTAITLDKCDWFHQILNCWGRPQTQQDCGEFILTVLQWFDCPGFNMSWERRCEENGTVAVCDFSRAFTPLLVQFSPNLATHDECNLERLIVLWQQVDGMRAALLQDAPMLCVQIDRLYCAPSGRIEKSCCAIDLNSEVTISCFCDQGLSTESIQYVLVAAAAHLGMDGAGHYRAALKVFPSMISEATPVQWLYTDDNVPPSPMWHLPETFCQNMTTAWLLRADLLQLPQFRTVETSAEPVQEATDPADQILALLRTSSALNVAPGYAEEE